MDKELFRIEVTPETSELVQTILNLKGFRWPFNGPIVRRELTFLVVQADRILWAIEADRTISLTDFVEWALTDKLPKTSSVTLGGKDWVVGNDMSLTNGSTKITLGELETATKAMEALTTP